MLIFCRYECCFELKSISKIAEILKVTSAELYSCERETLIQVIKRDLRLLIFFADQ